jgi:hypothetical protein
MSMIDDNPFAALADHHLISALQRRGYSVRHEGEARNPLSWNRTEPFPAGLDFRVEALEKIRNMIKPEMLSFSTRPYPQIDANGQRVDHTVHTAILRVL